jgi:hypothetical protein
MNKTQVSNAPQHRHTAKYRLRYDGGVAGAVLVTLLALTVILLPVAVILLLNDLEIDKFERRTSRDD